MQMIPLKCFINCNWLLFDGDLSGYIFHVKALQNNAPVIYVEEPTRPSIHRYCGRHVQVGQYVYMVGFKNYMEFFQSFADNNLPELNKMILDRGLEPINVDD